MAIDITFLLLLDAILDELKDIEQALYPLLLLLFSLVREEKVDLAAHDIVDVAALWGSCKARWRATKAAGEWSWGKLS